MSIYLNNIRYNISLGEDISRLDSGQGVIYSSLGDNPPIIPNPSTVIAEYSSSNTYEVKIPTKGYYQMMCCMAGNSTYVPNSNYTCGGAASGCLLTCEVFLPAGTIQVYVPKKGETITGKGDSFSAGAYSEDYIITLGGLEIFRMKDKNSLPGVRYQNSGPSAGYYHQAEVITTLDLISPTYKGNNGNSDSNRKNRYGGNSPVDNTRTGPGAGGGSSSGTSSSSGRDGYFKLTFLRQ